MKKITSSSPARTPSPSPPSGERVGVRGQRKSVLLVDDHPMMRAGMANLINKQPDLQICAEAGSPSEAQGEIAKSRPDLLVTDITMPGRSGVEFIKDVLAL